MNLFERKTKINLVPDAVMEPVVDYVCTWSTQGQVCGNGKTVRDVLTHDALFGENGWAYHLSPDVRKNFIFLLDDGWDLPYSVDGEDVKDYYGSFIVDPVKFPGYGDTPVARLKTLSDNVRKAGWAGLGVWVCCQEDAFHKTTDGRWDEAYWIEKILWSKEAGITYWKNDWGNHAYTHEWRQFVSRAANELYPELIMEHITGDYGTNDPKGTGTCEGRIQNMLRCASYSDVFRSYDVTTQLSVATTMDRVTRLLKDIQILPGDHMGLLNCEDELYLAAALGLSAGVMRSPLNHPHNLDEIPRLAAWHRIAPPFDMSAYDNTISESILTDEWFFSSSDTWDATIHNLTVQQHSAAAVSRGTDLPTARSINPPFMAAARNPITGAVSLVTLPRTQMGLVNIPLHTDISWNVGPLTGPIGIFGAYRSLQLTFNRSIEGLQILAQDLMDTEACDVTPFVTVQDNTLILDGELIHALGLMAGSSGDRSEPGLVLHIGNQENWDPIPPRKER